MSVLPSSAHAVQLTGPNELRINQSKPVPQPGRHQLLCQVEAVGLCFSDLKLLKQYSAHPRKKSILSGIDGEVLQQIPSYVPDAVPTVPGHEAVVRVVAAGPDTTHPVGLRALVQTDYRWLPTDGSNASFGYNFEGGLQEYVLLDERVIISRDGESMLIPVSEDLSASAVGLIEPWACVENAYVSPERQTALHNGNMLVVIDSGRKPMGVVETFDRSGSPGKVIVVGSKEDAAELEQALSAYSEVRHERLESVDEAKARRFDDIIYFGARKEMIESLDSMLAPRGLLNIVLGGERIGAPVSIGVGRAHYGGMRFIGTTGDSASESMKTIPMSGEIRPNEKMLIVGAAGPMGLMHVIRDLCQGVPDVEIVGTDFDDGRLDLLDSKAKPLAEKNGLKYRSVNPSKGGEVPKASYTVLMVPVPSLVAKAVEGSLPNGMINIFAGIPASVCHEIDMDAYIEKHLYLIGTSGSVIRDMKIVLEKVNSNRLDTNISVAAISGMAGALDGISAVENRTIPGKIIVYPRLHDLPLTPLEELSGKCPFVFAKLRNKQWTREAEAELLKGSSAISN